MAHNVDLLNLTLGKFIDFVWYMFTRDRDHQAVEKFRASVWQPPKGIVPDARSPWSAENETKAFEGFKALTGGGVAKPADATVP